MNMSLSPQPHDSPDIDGVLRDHFRQAMPSPWPAAPKVETAVAARESRGWSMMASRALAASTVVAIVVAYLGLASFFPREKAGVLDTTNGTVIGHNPNKLDPGKALQKPIPMP